MPIYAYRCSACGHAKDVLQKMSDPLLHTCPACGAETFTKQLTAAGFQLKGTGWYATDFKGGPAPGAGEAGEGGDKAKPADAAVTPAAATAGASTPAAAPAPAPSSSPSPASDGGRSGGGASVPASQGAGSSSAGH